MSEPVKTARYPTQAPIDAYGDGGFRFANMSHIGSLLCLRSGIHAWDARTPDDITLATLAPVLAQAATTDVLLIGTGATQVFLDAALKTALRDAGLVVEAMATGAAARTYNVLLGENRSVAAALLALGDPPSSAADEHG